MTGNLFAARRSKLMSVLPETPACSRHRLELVQRFLRRDFQVGAKAEPDPVFSILREQVDLGANDDVAGRLRKRPVPGRVDADAWKVVGLVRTSWAKRNSGPRRSADVG